MKVKDYEVDKKSIKEELTEAKLDKEDGYNNCQECVYCINTAISNGDAYYCHKNKTFIGDMDNVCEFFEYSEKPLKYIEVGKIREATKRYHSETLLHKQKVKQLNEQRKKSLKEYEDTIREYLKQHNQNFISDINVIDNEILIELEHDVGITHISMLVLDEISEVWHILPMSSHLDIYLKLWDINDENENEEN